MPIHCTTVPCTDQLPFKSWRYGPKPILKNHPTRRTNKKERETNIYLHLRCRALHPHVSARTTSLSGDITILSWCVPSNLSPMSLSPAKWENTCQMNSYHAHRLYSRALGSKNRVPKLISQDSAGGYIRDSASPNYSGVDIQTIDQVGNWYIFVWDGINSVSDTGISRPGLTPRIA
jgi:hypothetical protein